KVARAGVLKAIMLAVLASFLCAQSAHASFHFDDVGLKITQNVQARDGNGNLAFTPATDYYDLNTFEHITVPPQPIYDPPTFTRQAGSHPDLSFLFSLP